MAVFTEKILRLSSHMSRHHKDSSTKRRLQMLVLQRNRMLKYLRREQRGPYNAVISGLGIRPNRNFDPTVKPARAQSSAKKRRHRHASKKARPYGSEKSAKGRTKLRQHAHRQRAAQRAKDRLARAS